MSLCKSRVCKLILREHFGELAEKVGVYLLSNGARPLRQIANETSVKLDKVKTVVTVLIQQNIVSFEKNKRGFCEYVLNTDILLRRLQIPNFIYCAKTLYGDGAELVIEDVIHHGQILMSKVVSNVTNKLNEALENAGHPKISSSVVYDKFSCLAKTHFIQQCPNPLEEDATDDLDDRQLTQLYTVPPHHNLATKKRKRSVDESEQPTKKQKTDETEEKAPDDGIYWKINHSRFYQYFRDQLFVKAMSSKIDKKAGDILQTMLRLSEVKTEDLAFTSSPISFTEERVSAKTVNLGMKLLSDSQTCISQGLPKDLGITRHLCEQYLSIMADDTTRFISKVGESGGGMYTVNIMNALRELCSAHIESVVQERFGSKSLRIFRVLLLKKHLEQKQIEEMAMIPAKEAKELLYTMFAQNFITITEISKTPDHAPARTYYLFRVNLEQLARMLLENSFKALSNAMLKREMETKENRRLMEKQERVDAILSSLEQSGADEAQREEILQTITPSEKTQLTKVKHMINMLEQSELQLEETILVLELFLFYHDQKKKLKL